MRELFRSLLGPVLGLFGVSTPASAAVEGSEAASAGASTEEDGGSKCVGNLDRVPEGPTSFGAKDVAIVRRIELRIRNGELEVPQLSSTAISLLEVLNKPTAEMAEIADLFAADPFLSGQLLSTANSVTGGSRVGQTSIKACVVRVGMRSLRGMILAASMRSHLFNGRVANEYAEMAWRQALSVAAIGRAIAPHLGEDPESAFTIGLLHDIGKIPLLSMLAQEAGERSIDPALVGVLFLRLHEMAGAAVASDWRLGDELVSVCRQHHDFRHNEGHLRPAALAHLAHQLDLFLSLEDEVGYRELKRSAVMDALKVPDLSREAVLAAARAAFVAVADSPGSGASQRAA